MSIKTRPTYGKLQENTTNNDLRDKDFITGSEVGSKKIALDTRVHGVYLVGVTARVAEAASSDTIIQLTGHDMLVGDVVRILTTANGIVEREAGVKRIIDANNVELNIILSAAIAAGDTFDILRGVTPRYTDTGASLTTVTPSPISFNLDAAVQEVTEDTVTPANNAPLPVKITSTSGDINITAGDLNVQLSSTGPTYDSTRIGDGTNLWGINASLEGLVHDADNLVQNTAINAKLPATLGSKADAASLAVTQSTEDKAALAALSGKLPATLGQKAMTDSMAVVIASDQSAIDVNDIGGSITLPTGASTEAKQDALIALVPASLGQKARAASFAATLSTEDIAVWTALSAKLPAALGQQARAASLSTTMSTEDQALFPASLGSKADAASFAVTQSTEDKAVQAAMSAKLPSVIGQNAKADSLSVTLASDSDAITTSKMDVVSHFIDTTFAITTGAYTELIADIGATSGKKVQIFNGQGTPFYIAVGAAASEVDKLIVCPGGFPDGGIEVSLPANARISAKSIGANISAGTVIINIMG